MCGVFGIRASDRDVARLTAIPGVGKKTSERIVLELKDRLPLAAHAGDTPGPAAASPSALKDDVLSALINLGYHRPLAEKAVDAAVKKQSGDFEQTLRQALRHCPVTRAEALEMIDEVKGAKLLKGFRGKPASDGPRYKALGNSMAVPVMNWIGKRIQMVDAL